ncbi:MAG: hypothetical protein JJLCMIEE_02792 [Acidimicrobiales bacterium]|nr:hypothetical protein [Acidimicrobiales bacterium]
MTVVRRLVEVRATDTAFSGGKGSNLGELTFAGLPVPEGFVIGVPAYEAVQLADVGSSSSAARGWGSVGSIRDAILQSYDALGNDVGVAVRSSAVAEDGAATSYAGINETILNVKGSAELLAAVRRCWASASSSCAARYDDARGLAPRDHRIAVVVQRQIASASAGVTFTADPLTGRTDSVLIESVLGLGESVVSGRVTPDRIVVDKTALGIVSFDRGSQEAILEISLHGQGLVEHAVSAELSGISTITEEQAIEIARYALRIEAWYGAPQDIEWAIDGEGRAWILQTRPITTLAAPTAMAQAEQLYCSPLPAGSRWTRANVGEALPGVPTPLTWSVWSDGMDEAHWSSQIQLGVVPKREHRQTPVVALAGGWPAISVDLVESQLAQIPGMDPAAFSSQFFGESALVATAPLGARAATALRMAIRAPLSLAVLGRRLRVASATSAVAWRSGVWRPVSDPVVLLTEAATRFKTTMTVHSMQTYVCQALYQAVERFAGGQAIELVSGDGELGEAQLAADLWRLARSEITLDRFLYEHGFHGPCEGELDCPSWRQDPQPVLDTANSLAANDLGCNPLEAAAERRERRRQAEAALHASLPRHRRAPVMRLVRMARKAVVAREIGKAAFLQDLDVARHAASALGDEAVWHRLDELQAGVRLSPSELAARRRVRTQLVSREPPLAFVGDPGARASATPEQADAPSGIVVGIGASPGVARGRARVATNATGFGTALGADDVLIARTTDPSWVTTFIAAGGMAIDVGGALSHAAIIARELGIPCVIGTGSGTRRIPDGALVEIDGTRGTVRVLEVSAPAPDLGFDSSTP